MTEEEFEQFKNILIDIKKAYKDVSDEQLLSCLKTFIRMHRKITRDDLFAFVRMNVSLNNL